ncbi:TPR repeat-containing protein [Clostridium pasteurianum DSM 525 = ATCC 6013]|uniref:TPR repeat-containing protein n=1 Tax=Clostridium pasteurianum DSM 525 = ATCC 6013 TaxID=1262449 RepID=A0A0H3JAN0_CLOPA|nr:hypothetical protein [Clostridium pasteurianum]AJA49688.1 TPR repeat-containing protein [Clostridium pasteurianum DSM 525 = ATCC 6013]AJA53676.1 TPR repeat-containing protein [Clostridium pasteurianum DSM 525 = ATCC 6013]AOZ76838.1 hypothetical protein AQ983_17650 [Clostridium pasteurianum DSM 525 = ATCC 6013]AOZ80635.1 hypothetical protein AQ984_17645 [Clostridium pasteurianum]ELP57622.1 hypothetical protein F502_19103 [Clostridium pasteurianum DSM 525 = ATCC 6013]
MYKNHKFKIKLIVLIVFCIIGIGILVYNGKINYKNKYIVNKNINSVREESKNKEDKNKKQLDAKRKELDDLCEQGYNDFEAKKYAEAIEKENQVLTQDPDNYRAYTIKGIAICYSKLTSENYKEGIKEIDKALEIKSDYGYALFNKALAFELYGYYDEALIWYDKDLAVENRVWSYYGKASIYGRRGDVTNTVKNLKIAIDMQNNIKDVAKEETDFDNVRDSYEFKQLVN